MRFEHVNFNEDYWKGKSEDAFLKGESHHGLSKDQLKEVFAIINPPDTFKEDSLDGESPSFSDLNEVDIKPKVGRKRK